MHPHDLTNFDDLATVFADYGASLRGFVRYKLTQRNLEPFLTKKTMKILDIGGGSGPDAGWLAQKGHSITLIEPSAKQREYAQRRLNFFLEEPERQRIAVIPGELADIPKTATYDMVLLHGVAMYQANPTQFIIDAAKHVKRNGLLSIVEKGYYGAEARAVAKLDMPTLEALRATKRSLNHLQEDVYSFLPEELEEILEKQVNAKVLQWSGIRLLTDQLDVDIADMDNAELGSILRAEQEQGSHPAIRGQGQMLHFIARKR